MTRMTKRQGEVLSFIVDFIDRTGYPPTIRELKEGLGLKSNRGVIDHLRALERKGRIRRDPNSSRAIVPTDTSTGRMNGGRCVHYPVAGRIAAGPPSMPIEDVTEKLALDGGMFSERGDFMLEVKGDSMVGDHILAGDLVVVRRAREVKSGDLVIALVDGEATLKRYLTRDKLVILEPSNPEYEPIVFDGSKDETCGLIGKVIGVIRRNP